MMAETQGFRADLFSATPYHSKTNLCIFATTSLFILQKKFLGPCEVNKVQETISPGCIVNWKPLHANWRSRTPSPIAGLFLSTSSLIPLFFASRRSSSLFVPFHLPSLSLMTAKLHITIHHMAVYLIMSKNPQPLCKFQMFLRFIAIDMANAAAHSCHRGPMVQESSISC